MIIKMRSTVLLTLVALLTSSLGNAVMEDESSPNQYASSFYVTELFDFSGYYSDIVKLATEERAEYVWNDRNTEEWRFFLTDYLGQLITKADHWEAGLDSAETLGSTFSKKPADKLASLSRIVDSLSHRFGDYDY